MLPTDVTPTASNLVRTRPENALQLRVWQRLPASFFFNSSVETSWRIETNPFQNPLKRTVLKHSLRDTELSNQQSVLSNAPPAPTTRKTSTTDTTSKTKTVKDTTTTEVVTTTTDRTTNTANGKSTTTDETTVTRDTFISAPKRDIVRTTTTSKTTTTQSSVDESQSSTDQLLPIQSLLTQPVLAAINQQLGHSGATDSVYRINPNVTAGWAPTANTQVFANYFLLRDSLIKNSSLNSTTKAVGIGAQGAWGIGSKGSFQPQILVRELYQTAEPCVLDYLPSLTAQYQMTPNLVAYSNALLQVRMRHFVAGPQRELNPFYTLGWVYQRGRWQFSGSGTFIENVRRPFNLNSIIPVNNDSFVLDFEIDRQPFTSVPGLQAFVRAEPVYNFASHATPGLAGMDFRLYYGFRMTVSKPPLNAAMQQLMQRYKQQGQSQNTTGYAPIGPIQGNHSYEATALKIRNDIIKQL